MNSMETRALRPLYATVPLALLAIISLIFFVFSSVHPVRAQEDDASLKIMKVDEQNNRLAGAVFTVEGSQDTFTTGLDGSVCIVALPRDAFLLVTEIEAPPGFEIADPASQLVEVDNDGDCGSPEAIFVNAPAQVSVATPTPTPTPTPVTAVVTPTPSPTPAGGQLGGVSTPRPALPDTAIGDPMEIGGVLWSLVLLSAVATAAYVHQVTIRQRR